MSTPITVHRPARSRAIGVLAPDAAIVAALPPGARLSPCVQGGWVYGAKFDALAEKLAEVTNEEVTAVLDVRVTYDPTVRCTGSCRTATGPTCRCSCSGKGHGVSRWQLVDSEDVEPGLVRNRYLVAPVPPEHLETERVLAQTAVFAQPDLRSPVVA